MSTPISKAVEPAVLPAVFGFDAAVSQQLRRAYQSIIHVCKGFGLDATVPVSREQLQFLVGFARTRATDAETVGVLPEYQGDTSLDDLANKLAGTSAGTGSSAKGDPSDNDVVIIDDGKAPASAEGTVTVVFGEVKPLMLWVSKVLRLIQTQEIGTAGRPPAAVSQTAPAAATTPTPSPPPSPLRGFLEANELSPQPLAQQRTAPIRDRTMASSAAPSGPSSEPAPMALPDLQVPQQAIGVPAFAPSVTPAAASQENSAVNCEAPQSDVNAQTEQHIVASEAPSHEGVEATSQQADVARPVAASAGVPQHPDGEAGEAAGPEVKAEDPEVKQEKTEVKTEGVEVKTEDDIKKEEPEVKMEVDEKKEGEDEAHSVERTPEEAAVAEASTLTEAVEEEARRNAQEFSQASQEESCEKADSDAQRQADAEAVRKAAEESARIKFEEEAWRKAEEESKRKAAEEEAHLKAEAEAKAQVEEEAKRKAAEEEARRQAEAEEARRKAEEEAIRKANEEARKKVEEELARKKAEAEAMRKAAEEEKAKRQAVLDELTSMLESTTQRQKEKLSEGTAVASKIQACMERCTLLRKQVGAIASDTSNIRSEIQVQREAGAVDNRYVTATEGKIHEQGRIFKELTAEERKRFAVQQVGHEQRMSFHSDASKQHAAVTGQLEAVVAEERELLSKQRTELFESRERLGITRSELAAAERAAATRLRESEAARDAMYEWIAQNPGDPDRTVFRAALQAAQASCKDLRADQRSRTRDARRFVAETKALAERANQSWTQKKLVDSLEPIVEAHQRLGELQKEICRRAEGVDDGDTAGKRRRDLLAVTAEWLDRSVKDQHRLQKQIDDTQARADDRQLCVMRKTWGGARQDAGRDTDHLKGNFAILDGSHPAEGVQQSAGIADASNREASLREVSELKSEINSIREQASLQDSNEQELASRMDADKRKMEVMVHRTSKAAGACRSMEDSLNKALSGGRAAAPVGQCDLDGTSFAATRIFDDGVVGHLLRGAPITRKESGNDAAADVDARMDECEERAAAAAERRRQAMQKEEEALAEAREYKSATLATTALRAVLDDAKTAESALQKWKSDVIECFSLRKASAQGPVELQMLHKRPVMTGIEYKDAHTSDEWLARETRKEIPAIKRPRHAEKPTWPGRSVTSIDCRIAAAEAGRVQAELRKQCWQREVSRLQLIHANALDRSKQLTGTIAAWTQTSSSAHELDEKLRQLEENLAKAKERCASLHTENKEEERATEAGGTQIQAKAEQKGRLKTHMSEFEGDAKYAQSLIDKTKQAQNEEARMEEQLSDLYKQMDNDEDDQRQQRRHDEVVVALESELREMQERHQVAETSRKNLRAERHQGLTRLGEEISEAQKLSQQQGTSNKNANLEANAQSRVRVSECEKARAVLTDLENSWLSEEASAQGMLRNRQGWIERHSEQLLTECAARGLELSEIEEQAAEELAALLAAAASDTPTPAPSPPAPDDAPSLPAGSGVKRPSPEPSSVADDAPTEERETKQPRISGASTQEEAAAPSAPDMVREGETGITAETPPAEATEEERVLTTASGVLQEAERDAARETPQALAMEEESLVARSGVEDVGSTVVGAAASSHGRMEDQTQEQEQEPAQDQEQEQVHCRARQQSQDQEQFDTRSHRDSVHHHDLVTMHEQQDEDQSQEQVGLQEQEQERADECYLDEEPPHVASDGAVYQADSSDGLVGMAMHTGSESATYAGSDDVLLGAAAAPPATSATPSAGAAHSDSELRPVLGRAQGYRYHGRWLQWQRTQYQTAQYLRAAQQMQELSSMALSAGDATAGDVDASTEPPVGTEA